jgi:putative FmdB family regulatory protein
MPLYTFECPDCGNVEEVVRSVDERKQPLPCPRSFDELGRWGDGTGLGRVCGAPMKREVEMFEAKTLTPYFDEGLGADVHSFGEKRQIMSDLGVMETGDRVHGGRIEDRFAPEHVEKKPLEGKKYIKRKNSDEQIVETVDGDGRTVSKQFFGELKEN